MKNFIRLFALIILACGFVGVNYGDVIHRTEIPNIKPEKKQLVFIGQVLNFKVTRSVSEMVVTLLPKHEYLKPAPCKPLLYSNLSKPVENRTLFWRCSKLSKIYKENTRDIFTAAYEPIDWGQA